MSGSYATYAGWRHDKFDDLELVLIGMYRTETSTTTTGERQTTGWVKEFNHGDAHPGTEESALEYYGYRLVTTEEGERTGRVFSFDGTLAGKAWLLIETDSDKPLVFFTYSPLEDGQCYPTEGWMRRMQAFAHYVDGPFISPQK